jgi:glycosyltransferase involved in cell wall biosynthesis
MNVLFLIHRYPPAPGGSERYVQEMARRLVADGHRASVYTSNLLDVEGFWQWAAQRLPAGREEDRGVEVHRFPARPLPAHGALSRLLGLVPWAPLGLAMGPPGLFVPGLWRAVRAGNDFDLVHASAYPALLYLGAVAARRADARLALMPCTHPGQARYFLNRRLVDLYCQAGAVIALTGREQERLIQAGVPADRIAVTGAGVDPDEARGADGRRFRQEHGLPAGAPLIAFVGHKTEGKGALHLVEAARALLPGRPDLVLALAGASTPTFAQAHQSLPPEIRARVLDLQVSDREKHDLLAASSALALPSRDDSFGIVLLEAWLHSKPVVGARAGGIPDVVEDGRTGLLVPYGDVPALAAVLARLLDRPGEAAAMGARGQARTLARWTWDAVYGRLLAAYDLALGPGGGTTT